MIRRSPFAGTVFQRGLQLPLFLAAALTCTCISSSVANAQSGRVADASVTANPKAAGQASETVASLTKAKAPRTDLPAESMLRDRVVDPPALDYNDTYTNRRETPVVRAIRTAAPSVVDLHGQKTVPAGTNRGERARQVNGMGTGVIIDPRGYLITNYHVVEDVRNISVTLNDGRSTLGRTIATDVKSDLALVKIDVTEPLPVMQRAPSDDLMVGETVIAIGNAFGYNHTCTQGIISALHRDVPVDDTKAFQQEYRDLVQISAGINPGNSGGPLLNVDGKMIGINVAVRVGAQAIAFAIPSDQVVEIVSRMIKKHLARSAIAQINTKGGPHPDDGVVVQSVSSGAVADVRPGDQIVAIGNTPVRDELQFLLAALPYRASTSLPIVVRREGQDMQVALTNQQRNVHSVASSSSNASADSSGWGRLGIATKPMSSTQIARWDARMRREYEGGLQVTQVRRGSPSAKQGIRPGDILLGLNGWQTAADSDLRTILAQPKMERGGQSKFYILRSGVIRYGFFQLAALDSGTSNQFTQRR
ncbi:MAG: trypsin-like peptidase domain-containing protein [Planctomycetota bacterium]